MLPKEGRGRNKSVTDNRKFLNGMLYVLHHGCSWREMDKKYGKWNSVYVRFSRWCEQGIWDELLKVIADMRLADDWERASSDGEVGRYPNKRGNGIRLSVIENAKRLRCMALLETEIG